LKKHIFQARILAAWKNSLLFPGRPDSRKCFLTIVGGGVFLNPPEFFGEAIVKCQQTIVDSELEVFFVIWSRKRKRGDRFFDVVARVVEAIGGSVIRVP
jgi:hypothetical protein